MGEATVKIASHGFNAVVENGPAASELAADAHHCIMVRVSAPTAYKDVTQNLVHHTRAPPRASSSRPQRACRRARSRQGPSPSGGPPTGGSSLDRSCARRRTKSAPYKGRPAVPQGGAARVLSIFLSLSFFVRPGSRFFVPTHHIRRYHLLVLELLGEPFSRGGKPWLVEAEKLMQAAIPLHPTPRFKWC